MCLTEFFLKVGFVEGGVLQSLCCLSVCKVWGVCRKRVCKKTKTLQPIADRVAQNLEIIFKNFQFSTRRTRILMGFIIYYLVLIINPMGRILVRSKRFRNNLEILCHPICNRLYLLSGCCGVAVLCMCSTLRCCVCVVCCSVVYV